MRIADGVEMLEISANIMGSPNVIYPTLLWDDDTAILVDAGFPGQLHLIQEAVEKAGVAMTCAVEQMAGHLHFSDGLLSKVIFGLRLVGINCIIYNS